MNFMDLCNFLEDIKAGRDMKVLASLEQLFGLEKAIYICSSYCNISDERIVSILSDMKGGMAETHEILVPIWSQERLRLTQKPIREEQFIIKCTGDATGKYELTVSVHLAKGEAGRPRAYVWYHHVSSHERFPAPEACVDWHTLEGVDEAMWTLLISKVERLSNEWFVEAARESQQSLLVPPEIE